MTYEQIVALITIVFANISGLVALYFKLRHSGAVRTGYLSEELRSCVNELKAHQETSIQKLNGMLSYLISSLGRPAWLKVASTDANGKTVFRMLVLNAHYGDIVGVHVDDYVGKTDLEAGWNHETARQFHDHDLLVWSTGESQDFFEVVNGERMRFRKIPVKSPSGDIKGVFGFAVDCGAPDQCPVHCPCVTTSPSLLTIPSHK